MNEKLSKLVHAVLCGISPRLDEKYGESLVQFVKFCIVGLSNTLLSYILNILVLLALRGANVSWDYIAGNVISFILSVLWSFYWNNKYVFTKQEGKQRAWWKALLKTYLCYAFTGILLNNILSWLWITKFGVSKYLAPVFNLVISIPVNFLLNKLWAFKDN